MSDNERKDVLSESVEKVGTIAEDSSQTTETVTEGTGVTAPAEEVTAPAEEATASAEEAAPGVPLVQMQELVESATQQILTAFTELRDSFDGKLRYDAKKDEIIDRQNSELSQFKSGLIEKVTMQIINDLIGEIDAAQKLARFYENAEFNETNFKKLCKVVCDIPESLCDILEKYGVLAYSSTEGRAFDPKRQRALKTTETGDASQDKIVRELLRMGFEQELDSPNAQGVSLKVLRPEMVDVYVFKPELTAPAEEVTAPAEEVTAPAEEVTAPAEEVTAPAEEVTAPAEEVTAPAE